MESLYENFEYLHKTYKQSVFKQGEKASNVYLVVEGLVTCTEVKYSLGGGLNNALKDKNLQKMIFVPKPLREKTVAQRVIGPGSIFGCENPIKSISGQLLYSYSATVTSEKAILLTCKNEVCLLY